MAAVMRDMRDTEIHKRPTALLYAEKRLSAWASWAKANRERLGLPTISLIYKAMRERSEPARRSWRVPKLAPDESPQLLTAIGRQSRSMMPLTVDCPDHIAEVDAAVIRLPADLHTVIMTDYFSYGPIEVRAKQTRWKRARYSQLLESAKYSVFCSLYSRDTEDFC